MSFGGKFLTGSVLAFIGLLTIKLLGALMGLLAFLFFTVLPIMLVGFLVYKAIRHFRRDKPAYE